MEAGEFATIQELAEAVGLAERHVSRQLRLAYLGPEVLKRLTCGREASASLICVFWLGRLGGAGAARGPRGTSPNDVMARSRLSRQRSAPQCGFTEPAVHASGSIFKGWMTGERDLPDFRCGR